MSNLRVGLVGLGMMGQNHARVLANLEGIDFVGVCDPIKHTLSKSQGRPIVSSLQELISLKLDYAVVAVPTVQHLEVGLQLAYSGIHALIEKPLAAEIEDAQELTYAFKKAGLLGGVGFIERFNPALQEARKRIEQLGTLHQVVTRRQGPFPTRIADVGVVKDLATHDVDLTAWVTSQDYLNVSARVSSKSERGFEDMVAVIASLSEGTIANHLVNWLSPIKERLTILTGEKGSFVIDTLTADLTYYANGNYESDWDALTKFRGVSEGDVTRYAINKNEPLKLEHENFRDAVLDKQNAIVTMEESLITAGVINAILSSAKTLETVTIDK